VIWSRAARSATAVAVACIFAAGCSISSAVTPPPGVASGTRSHTERWTRGMLAYWLQWHVSERGIQIVGFRARFITCHRVFLSLQNAVAGSSGPRSHLRWMRKLSWVNRRNGYGNRMPRSVIRIRR
jgi:hypothetical protein